MSEPFIGEIRMLAGNFAPNGWAFCDGQLMAISQNDALFSLLGTTYGGDGETTFGLPDLRGRIPIHGGTGPGLSSRLIGSNGGAETVTLTTPQLPSHSHEFAASTTAGSQGDPQSAVVAASPNVRRFRPQAPNVDMSAAAVGSAGGNQSHTNMMPSLCVSFIIALFGIYPTQS